jgi:DNA-binding MarR family transcriptional regulator
MDQQQLVSTKWRERALTWVLEQGGLTLSQKAVLMVIAASSDPDERYAFVSKDELARRACTGRKTITNAIAALVLSGHIRVARTVAEDGGNLANRYYLSFSG